MKVDPVMKLICNICSTLLLLQLSSGLSAQSPAPRDNPPQRDETNRTASLIRQPQSNTTSVYRSELFPAGMNGVALYRIPGVVCTSQGTLLAYCEARRNGRADWGEIEVHLRRSTDGGASWSDAMNIAHLGPRIEGNPRKKNDEGAKEQTVNNPVAIVDHQTKRIELLYCINYARCFSIRSSDDGITWTKPVEITAAFEAFREHYNWNVIATGPGHGIQMQSGRLVVPIWLAYGKDGDHAPSAAATIYSDDHGDTWKAGDLVFPNTESMVNPNETMIAALSSGAVMLVNRNHAKASRKLVSISLDGATGWSEPKFQAELWEPICMASVVAYPAKPGTMIFSNPHSLALDKEGKEIPAGRGKRENLSIKVSYDDGKTWPVNKTLEKGPSAYSDLAVLQDGKIVCLFEGNNTITFAKFDLSWVTER